MRTCSIRTARATAAIGRLGCALALLAAPAAALAQQGTPASAPANVVRLERARADKPSSVPALRALGIAYYRSGRPADARPVLVEARRLAPTDGVVALYLGMSAEAQGDLAAAREAYTSYLTVGKTSRVRAQLRARLTTLAHRELEVAARSALAREAELSSTPGLPRVVAVLPLTFSGADSSLKPLERGLAELLVTDLSRSAELTVVERARMQAIVDEINVSGSAVVDAGTAVRPGRILQAGRVVSGSITQLPNRQLSVNAAVIDVPTARAGRAVTGGDRLEQLFALEKKIAFDLFDALGVRLSPQERLLVEERPTRSLAAFLSYSRGLLSEDRGQFDDAARNYDDALKLDPGFTLARTRKESADLARVGQGITTRTVEGTLVGSAEGAVVAAADRGLTGTDLGTLTGTIGLVVGDLNPTGGEQLDGTQTTGSAPSPRDPVSATTNTDAPAAQTGRITIIIKQPK